MGAVGYVVQDTLRASEKDAAGAAARRVEALPDAVGEGQDTRRQREQAGADLVGGELRLAEAAQQRVVVHQQAFHAQAQQVGIGEVAEQDGAEADLVLAGRAAAATGGTLLAVSPGRPAPYAPRTVPRPT